MDTLTHNLNLKDRYVYYLLDNADYAYEMWQKAHDKNKKNRARKWMTIWQWWLDELELVHDEPAGRVARYITNSLGCNSIVNAFAFEAWGWYEQPMRLEPIFD